jgi:hypothetical protein
MAMQIPPAKYEIWRQTVSELSGPRSKEFNAARRRQGVNWQCVFVQQTPQGPMEILVMDADDPARAFQEMGRSQEPFDVWFRQFLMEIYGLDLSQPPTGPPPEKVLDWTALVEQPR